MKKEYLYFVSYAHNDGFGNSTVVLSKSLRTVAALNSIADHIKANNNFDERPIILFYRKLSHLEAQ